MANLSTTLGEAGDHPREGGMRQILSIRFGSHLYGTATPQSDLDFKSVHIPVARDILLGRAKGSISTKRPKAEGEKNFAGEIDDESYSLQRYLGLLAEGQTVAVDLLFAPDWACLMPPAPEWREIFANRHRLVSRKSAAFVGYCRTQANKYGIKGSRVAAARAALSLLNDGFDRLGSATKLREMAPEVESLAASTEHMEVLAIPQVDGSRLPHWEVCGRRMAYSASIGNARGIMAKIVDEYGHRALKAETQQGVDWKALSHAVRVARQAIDLFRTGEIVFPLANAAELLAIKTGQRAYQSVAEEIEGLLAYIETAAEKSTLRESADTQWIDDFVFEVYRSRVAA